MLQKRIAAVSSSVRGNFENSPWIQTVSLYSKLSYGTFSSINFCLVEIFYNTKFQKKINIKMSTFKALFKHFKICLCSFNCFKKISANEEDESVFGNECDEFENDLQRNAIE